MVVARIDGDASVMSPLDAAGMAIKQQAVDLHHPVNPLVIGRLQASGQRLALENGVDTSVATLPRCAVAFAIATDAVQDRMAMSRYRDANADHSSKAISLPL